MVALARRETGERPDFAPAWRAHLRRFPSVGSGLNQVETEILRRLDLGGQPGLDELCGALSGHAAMAALGMGDLQVAATLRDLARGPSPLVKIDAPGSSIEGEGRGLPGGCRRWRITIADGGRDVLAGARDQVTVNGIDRYLGGARLHGNHGVWRWDDREAAIVIE
jgi:hypothetical protein